jgi:2C-methyl-D-erythritol 2,4-cyclodiphosphate synthase
MCGCPQENIRMNLSELLQAHPSVINIKVTWLDCMA